MILSMTLFAVHRVHMQHEYSTRRWRFGDALCVQGIWYVAATCAVNIPVATLAFLNLNRACLSSSIALASLTQRSCSWDERPAFSAGCDYQVSLLPTPSFASRAKLPV